MRDRIKSLVFKRVATGAALLVFLPISFWCAQATASGIDILDDRAAADNATLETLASELNVDDSIQHATTGNQDTAADTENPADRRASARAAVILRKIFDEANADDQLRPTGYLPSAAGRPLPGKVSNNDSVQLPDAETDELQDRSTVRPDSSASLPGIATEQSLRYRQQMYRTDI